MRFFAALFVLGALARPAYAVEAKAVRIADTWSVVGVISASDPTSSVAVLRNTQTQHTYTLAIGDALPNEFGFALKAIQSRSVVVTGDKTDVTLSFAEASVAPAAAEKADDADEKTRTARFIDNYYRGLSEAPIEVLRGGDDDSDTHLKFPLRHFGTLREDAARSRFDLYKADVDGDDQDQDEGANQREFDDVPTDSQTTLDSGVDQAEVPPARVTSPDEVSPRILSGDGGGTTRIIDMRSGASGTDEREPRGAATSARDLFSN